MPNTFRHSQPITIGNLKLIQSTACVTYKRGRRGLTAVPNENLFEVRPKTFVGHPKTISTLITKLLMDAMR